jgi:ABC-type polysaccharide/polyol phosphate transport system ATPase subunit
VSAEQPIAVDDVSFSYERRKTAVGSVKELALHALRGSREVERVWALRDVSLHVGRGEAVGVVGANGAGKSTLLRLIGRILVPTTGRIVLRGHVASVLELGSALSPDLDGRDNIVLYGTLLGRDPATMRRRAEEIAEWAGLRDVLDEPVRTYSTGMAARLAFAVATDGEPDVLIVDEVLAVGDLDFRDRSRERMDALMHSGSATLLVSHDLELVAARATRAMWLTEGRTGAVGEPMKVIEAYVQDAERRAGTHLQR